MKSIKAALAVSAVVLASAGSSIATASEIEERSAASRAAIGAFFGDLKGELIAGIKAGGPANAIGVCNSKAPEIATSHSKAKGWDIARVSLKNRNPDNAPDAWEHQVLMDFEKRKAGGEDPKKMEFAEIVTTGGKKEFRYMKAIPTAPKPCLACHGTTIKPEVTAKLDELYPNDKARGYSAGDIRGAFTIRQPM